MPTDVLKELSKYLFVIQIHHNNYLQLSEWRFYHKKRSRLALGLVYDWVTLVLTGPFFFLEFSESSSLITLPYCSRFPEHSGFFPTWNSRRSPISALPPPLLNSEFAHSIGQESNCWVTKCGLSSILLKAETQTQTSIKGPSKLVEVNYEEPMAPQQRVTSVT